ncbi:galanin receptor 2b-like, partial [Lethenteron reissneri]|uniref:galanin receptor 2b-like n=1 Tax=Lethenteron reissneri TaxID=7753 RepID=UPI002AB7233B
TMVAFWNASEPQGLSPESVTVPVVFLLIFLLGAFGNSLVIIVLLCSGQRGSSNTTTNIFILNLSVADLCFILFCVPFQATIYTLDGWIFGSFLCKAVHFIIFLTMFASSFTLAAVSVDRYLAIRYPLRSRELRTPRKAAAVIAAIWGLALVFAGPYLSYYQAVTFQNMSMCMPVWAKEPRKLMDMVTFVCGYLVPVSVLGLAYAFTLKYLWTAVDPLEEMSESKRAKRKVTTMILIVAGLFCACWLPHHVLILYFWFGHFPLTHATYAFRLLSHCMSYANSCLNPLVYALVSKHFRKGFRKAFAFACGRRCCCHRRRHHHHHHHHPRRGRVTKVHVLQVANRVDVATTELSHNEAERAGSARHGSGGGGGGGGSGGGVHARGAVASSGARVGVTKSHAPYFAFSSE